MLLRLVDHGSRSAVKAALVHTAIKTVRIERIFDNVVTADIKKPDTLNTLVRISGPRGAHLP